MIASLVAFPEAVGAVGEISSSVSSVTCWYSCWSLSFLDFKKIKSKLYVFFDKQNWSHRETNVLLFTKNHIIANLVML
jgi:hypothetical protein